MEFVLRTRLGAFQPNADVFVDDEGCRVVVVVEVAGADPESLSIGIDERYLVVAGRRFGSARRRRRHPSYRKRSSPATSSNGFRSRSRSNTKASRRLTRTACSSSSHRSRRPLTCRPHVPNSTSW